MTGGRAWGTIETPQPDRRPIVPAYFVIHNRVTDDEAMQVYLPKAVETLMAHGAEVLVVADDSTVVEGSTDFPRTIVIKFDTRDQAMAWYDSPDYQAAVAVRLRATEGYAVLVDGFEVPG
jgi:uncharacterized protein (DUF1330 family)